MLQYWRAQNTPVLALQNDSNTNYLAISFKRRIGVSNVTHAVELSDDLGTWTPGSTYSADGDNPSTPLTTQVSRSGTNTETIVVRENAPLGSAAQRFMRVRVIAP